MPDDSNGEAASPEAPSAKRKKTSASSSRGVANLTPEQLARKRANDREAQRAIRERTKNQIDTLNARIKELESAQPFHDLQQALRQRDAIQAENEGIKRSLATVIGILQPLLGTQGLNELAAAAERNALPIQPSLADQTTLAHLSPNDTGSYHESILPAGQAPNNVDSPGQQAAVSGRNWHFGDVASPADVRTWPTGSASFDSQRSSFHPDLQYGHSDERLGVGFLLSDNRQRVAHLQNGTAVAQSASLSPDAHSRSVTSEHAHLDAWATLPKFMPPTCPLDTLLMDFLAERKRLGETGVSPEALAGPPYPNFDSIIDPDAKHHSHEVSRVFTDILRTFPDISRAPEQVAVVYIMFLVMRWMVNPTRENYEQMPEWVQPRPSQLFTPYPHWSTYLPWPRLRDRIVASQAAPPFDQFFIPYTTTVSLNWPYEARHVLIRNSSSSASQSHVRRRVSSSASPATPAPSESYSTQYVMNPAFESHLRDLSNWSLGPEFITTFPDFKDTVRIKGRNS